MVVGLLTGLLFQWLSLPPENFLRIYLVDGLFDAVGQIFIVSLKMLVVPLVFVSLTCGAASLGATGSIGRLGSKAIGLYLLTTAIAVTMALSVSLIIDPGMDAGSVLEAPDYQGKEPPGIKETLINIFPDNPIASMAEGEMLQIIVFAVLLGVAMAMTGDAGKRLAAFFEDVNTVIMRLVTIIMNLAPYGVFVLMAKLFATIGLETIGGLLWYFFLVLAVLVIHALVTYPVLLKVFSGMNPLILLQKMRDAALFAFSTSSSSATLPVTMETARNKLGIGKSVSSFTLPLGATINMDGTAIMQGVATVFIAQVYGVDLSLGDYVMVVLTATLASVGTAGVPGVGLIMLAMVLQQVNLPVEGIALIIGVDRLLDMTRTAVNITGDCTVATIIAKTEGELDEAVFNDPDAGHQQEEVDFEHFDKNKESA